MTTGNLSEQDFETLQVLHRSPSPLPEDKISYLKSLGLVTETPVEGPGVMCDITDKGYEEIRELDYPI